MRGDDWRPLTEAVPHGTPLLLCAGPPEALGPGHREWHYGVGTFTAMLGLCDWPWSSTPTHWQPLLPPEAEGE